MQLEPAVAADLPAVVALRDEAARWLASRGIEQWAPGERTVEQLRGWLGDLYVLRRDGTVVASVALRDHDPDVWPRPPVHGRAGYLHLLIVSRRHAGQRLGDAVLAWAEAELVRTGRDLARLDAVAANPALQRWYAARGYVAWDTVEVPGLSPVVRREKALAGAGPPGAHGTPPRQLTGFQRAVTDVVGSLAAGEVVTYAEVALEAGHPGSAQAVANVLRRVPGLPWWRVVPADGRIYRTHASRQVPRLRAEGVEVGDDRRVRG